MRTPNRNTKHPHKRRKKHAAACEKPQVRKLIDSLKEDWDNLSLVERGQRLRQLVALGCTTRGLEDELGRSDTAIRRNMKIAALPEQHRQAVEQGASAKKVLAAQRDAGIRRRMRERIQLDAATGEISDAAAQVIIQFCRQRQISTSYVPQLVSATVQDLSTAPCTTRSVHTWPKKLATLLRDTRPKREDKADRVWLIGQAECLANILRAIAPEEPIYSRATQKAEIRAKNELQPKPVSPKDAYRKIALRFAQLSSSPTRRKY